MSVMYCWVKGEGVSKRVVGDVLCIGWDVR